jgi:hypothetical protein
MDRRHVDEEAAGQRDVAGDAGALLAERFLGDLDDDVLTGFQHFADELRTARRTGMAMTTIVAGSAGATWTAFESRAGRTTATITTAIGTAATAVWTTTTSAVTPSALRTLKTGAGIAADAGGITREIFARSRGAADTRGASLTGKQDDIFFDDRGFRSDLAGVRFDYFWLSVFVFDMLVLSMLVFSVFVHEMLGITESGSVFGAFVRGVGFEFGAIRGAVLFDFFRFILGKFGLRGGLVFGGVQVRFFLAFFLFGFFFGEFGFASGVNFLRLVLFEFGATCEGIDFGVIGRFLVFSLGELKREGGGLLLAQLRVAANGRGI